METDKKPRRMGHYEMLPDGRTVFMRPNYGRRKPPQMGGSRDKRTLTGYVPAHDIGKSAHDVTLEKQSPDKFLSEVQKEAEVRITEPSQPSELADTSREQQ